MLARLLNLNDVQSGVLDIIFRIADDQELLLLDFKDLRAITQYIGDNAKSFQNQYGNISSASVGAIQRGLLSLEQQGAAHFFGEPMLDIKDWMRTDANGKGVINDPQRRETLSDAETVRRQPAVDAFRVV